MNSRSRLPKFFFKFFKRDNISFDFVSASPQTLISFLIILTSAFETSSQLLNFFFRFVNAAKEDLSVVFWDSLVAINTSRIPALFTDTSYGAPKRSFNASITFLIKAGFCFCKITLLILIKF